jgi:hypothetical protein
MVALAVAGLIVTAVEVRAGGSGSNPGQVVDGCFTFSVRLAHHSVRAGQGVGFAVTARNTTRHGCTGRPCMGVTPTWDVDDPGGHLVYRHNAAGVLCAGDAPPPPTIAAGARTTWDVGIWDGRQDWKGYCRPDGCHSTRPPARPGLYHVVWHRLPGDPPVPSDWFALG